MSKYTFRIKQILYGELDVEIGGENPSEYINERIEMGLTVNDFSVIDDDTECEWFNKFPEDIKQ